MFIISKTFIIFPRQILAGHLLQSSISRTFIFLQNVHFKPSYYILPYYWKDKSTYYIEKQGEIFSLFYLLNNNIQSKKDQKIQSIITFNFFLSSFQDIHNFFCQSIPFFYISTTLGKTKKILESKEYNQFHDFFVPLLKIHILYYHLMHKFFQIKLFVRPCHGTQGPRHIRRDRHCNFSLNHLEKKERKFF